MKIHDSLLILFIAFFYEAKNYIEQPTPLNIIPKPLSKKINFFLFWMKM